MKRYGAILAQPCYVDPNTCEVYLAKPDVETIRFDSTLESNTYCILRKVFEINEIKVQHPLVVHPAQGFWDELKWKVDFAIEHNGRFLYVESKGVVTREYLLLLRLYSQQYSMKDLLTVGYEPKRLGGGFHFQYGIYDLESLLSEWKNN